MSRARLLGVQHKQGEFQGRPFNCLKLHVAEKFAIGSGNDFGEEVTVQKVKVDNVPAIFGQSLSLGELVQYIGSEMEVYYDKYGHFSEVHFIPPENSKK